MILSKTNDLRAPGFAAPQRPTSGGFDITIPLGTGRRCDGDRRLIFAAHIDGTHYWLPTNWRTDCDRQALDLFKRMGDVTQALDVGRLEKRAGAYYMRFEYDGADLKECFYAHASIKPVALVMHSREQQRKAFIPVWGRYIADSNDAERFRRDLRAAFIPRHVSPPSEGGYVYTFELFLDYVPEPEDRP